MARVLVVDDDHVVREVLASYLRGYDHDVVEAADGPQALRTLEDAPADLVVLGATMTGIGGPVIVATKPYDPRDLALRADLALRRTAAGLRTLVDGDLVLDQVTHAVTVAGAPVALTAREFGLLRYLVAHPDTAHSRRQLLADVWGWTVGDESTVTVHVRRLREKVERDPASPERLVTVWGVGYRWERTG